MKNRICTPIPPPTVPLDWLGCSASSWSIATCWTQYPQLGDWMVESRLDPVARSIRFRLSEDAKAMKHIGRYLTNFGPAQAKLDELMAE